MQTAICSGTADNVVFPGGDDLSKSRKTTLTTRMNYADKARVRSLLRRADRRKGTKTCMRDMSTGHTHSSKSIKRLAAFESKKKKKKETVTSTKHDTTSLDNTCPPKQTTNVLTQWCLRHSQAHDCTQNVTTVTRNVNIKCNPGRRRHRR